MSKEEAIAELVHDALMGKLMGNYESYWVIAVDHEQVTHVYSEGPIDYLIAIRGLYKSVQELYKSVQNAYHLDNLRYSQTDFILSTMKAISNYTEDFKNLRKNMNGLLQE